MGIRALIPQKAINYLKHLPLAVLALLYYRFPSRQLKVIGVTGTDGKTTTVSLIYHILREAGLSVAMVSTVSARIGGEEIETGFHVTAPSPRLLQKLLRKMVDQGVKYAILEVTSHGLDQFRLFGIDFEIGVLTNITREHLDYHQTFENYLRAKAKLFGHSKTIVINRDDESYEYLQRQAKNKTLPAGRQERQILTYGIKNEADFTPKKFSFQTKLPGEYNQYNCLAAIAAASILGVASKTIKEAVAGFAGISGRMEEINEGQDFRVLIDFAHTPNALKQVLGALKEPLRKGSKLIAVFGAAGLRDKGKRPIMGEIAGRLADLVILTAEDPRTEKAEEICREIAAGCRKAEIRPTIIPDRTEAIKFAVKKAKKGDILIVCGKGHEKSMCFGEKEYPWSDEKAVRNALRRLK